MDGFDWSPIRLGTIMSRQDHESFVLLTKAFNGGMVNSAETAVAIAAAILKGHFGTSELARQQPLRAIDEGDSWFVKGSHRDPDLEPEDGGSWHIRIMKDDARVVAMGHSILDLKPPEQP